jgi:hypothetical protein
VFSGESYPTPNPTPPLDATPPITGWSGFENESTISAPQEGIGRSPKAESFEPWGSCAAASIGNASIHRGRSRVFINL